MIMLRKIENIGEHEEYDFAENHFEKIKKT